MKLIIFDFEVFKYDVLLGLYVVDNDDRSKKELYQTWDKEKIKKIYQLFQNDIWIGHNNKYYDNHILEAIVRDKDPYNISYNIVNKRVQKAYTDIHLYSFDLNEEVMVKLKLTEAYFGKNIHILNEVSFDIDRPLTDEEKKQTEIYNKSDLDQTYENFLALQHTFNLKLNIMKEFNVSYEIFSKSVSNVSANCLKVRKNNNLQPLKEIYKFPQLRLQNQELWDFYINQRYRTDKLIVTINGVEHQLGIGGIHGARGTWYTSEKIKEHKNDKGSFVAQSNQEQTIWYFDVSGYYNLLMINYDLFSRSMSEESKKMYTHLYHEQLKLKGIDDTKRETFKNILLAVFGATKNKFTEFYDPYHFEMITLWGQLFLVDLLEKLDPYITLIQSNTDGIILMCKNTYNEKIVEIVDEWQNRTGFTLKREKLNKIFQRDVNNYLIEKENGKVSVKGEALKYSDVWNKPFFGFGSFKYKEPLIISILMREALLHGTLPEQEIEKWKHNLTLFQFICKKDTYDRLLLVENDKEQEVQEIVRVFPSNEQGIKRCIYKSKVKNGKISKAKIANLPECVFMYNYDIRDDSTIQELSKKIDWNWYIERAYERLDEFL